MSDAVVIGSGPNGLAAAIRLAEAGRSVTVCESAGRPGGAMRTEELTLPGFHHDTFSAVYPSAAASPVFARMPLAEHGLEWIHPRACMAHPLDAGEAVVLYRDLRATAETLERQRAGDGERWSEFAAPYLRHFDAIRETMLAPFPPTRGALHLLHGIGPGASAHLLRLVGGSSVGFAQRLFRGDGSRAWLYGSAMHGDAPLRSAGSGLAAIYLHLLGHAVGWPSPRGGAERLTDALVSYLTSLGGEIRTGGRVERIVSRGGRVRGVCLSGGQEIPAGVVIADVMPHALNRMTGEALSAWYRWALGRYVYGPATLKVDWALEKAIPWLNSEVAHAGTVHVGGSEREMLISPRSSFLLLGQQSIADPSRAPAGSHTAWAYTRLPTPHDLDQPRMLEAIEAQVERFAPGFRDVILARHILTPDELEARNANLVGGDVGGGSTTLRQVLFRPLPKLSPYSTPLRGLFLGSAATFPGAAVHGVPGDAAARAALGQS